MKFCFELLVPTLALLFLLQVCRAKDAKRRVHGSAAMPIECDFLAREAEATAAAVDARLLAPSSVSMSRVLF